MWHNRERAIDSRLAWGAPDEVRLPVHGITPEGRFLYVNDFACARLGDTRDELLRMTGAEVDLDCPFDARQAHWSKLKHPDGLPRTIRVAKGLLRVRKDRNRAARCEWAS